MVEEGKRGNGGGSPHALRERCLNKTTSISKQTGIQVRQLRGKRLGQNTVATGALLKPIGHQQKKDTYREGKK